MAVAAYSSTVKAQGTSTTLTNEPCSQVSGLVYRVTDATKRILDPGVALTVYDGASPVSATVDFLFGTVTLAGSPSGSVTVSGAYLPTVSVAEVTDYSFQASANMLDKTSLDSAGVKAHLTGLKDLSGSLTVLVTPFYDHDTGAGTKTVAGLFDAGTPVLLELTPPSSSQKFRAWILLENWEEKGSVDGLLQMTVSFTGAARQASGRTESAAFGWG